MSDISNASVASAVSGRTERSVLEFRLGSYNLRMEHLDTDDDNRWTARRPRLMESIRLQSFDVAGLQEVNSMMQADLEEEFGKIYTFWFFSPYSQDGVGDKAHGIMFRSSEYLISDKRFFWASDTPDVCSVTDIGPKGNYRRGGCCAVLTHISSGIRFFLMCTHACYNDGPNARYASVYRAMESRYNPERLPSFFVGDMNADPGSEASQAYRNYWNDSFLMAHGASRTGLQNTYNGYEYPSGSNRIDYIYFRGEGIKVKSYGCDGSLYDRRFASDHFPITADIRIARDAESGAGRSSVQE